MHIHPGFKLLMAVGAVLLCACTTTTLSGSWRSPDYRGQIHKPYVVGVSKNETTRRIFEDRFAQELQAYGISSLSSYRDLPDVLSASKESLSEHVRNRGADSLLMVRVTGKRTEEVVTPGRISGYQTGPVYSPRPYSPYYPDPYYRNWGSYYDRRFEATYEPATVTQVQIVNVEANLYEAKSGELIWSAQLETVVEGETRKLVDDFIKAVTKDLLEQGLL